MCAGVLLGPYLLLGGQVPRCMGLDNTACIAAWERNATVLDRLFTTPVAWIGAFLVASAATLIVQFVRR